MVKSPDCPGGRDARVSRTFERLLRARNVVGATVGANDAGNADETAGGSTGAAAAAALRLNENLGLGAVDERRASSIPSS